MAVVDDTALRNEIRDAISHGEFLAHLSEDERESIIGTLLENTLSAINLAILERMSEQEREELLRRCDSSDDDAVLSYVEKIVGDLNPIARSAVESVISAFKLRLYRREAK